MSEFVAEFIGTALLMLLGGGVNANNTLTKTKGHQSGWLLVTLGWGLSVFIAVAVVAPYSGAHINPAVSIGLAAAGKFSWAKVPVFIIAQMLGAFLGSFMVWLNYKDHFNATEDAASKLGVFSTGPAIRNYPLNFFNELTGTYVLVFVILYFVDPSINTIDGQATKIGLGSVGALPVALLVTVIGFALGGTSGYAINPARDFVPRVLHAILPIQGKSGSDWAYAWVPILGPTVGGILAAFTFLALN